MLKTGAKVKVVTWVALAVIVVVVSVILVVALVMVGALNSVIDLIKQGVWR